MKGMTRRLLPPQKLHSVNNDCAQINKISVVSSDNAEDFVYLINSALPKRLLQTEIQQDYRESNICASSTWIERASYSKIGDER